MTTENHTCNNCSRSTDSSPCPKCGNDQFCSDCDQCNVCGPKPGRFRSSDPYRLFHVNGEGLATYLPVNYAEAILRNLDGRALTDTQKKDLAEFYDAVTLRFNEYKYGRCS
jgi:hypothetical protein